MSPVKYELSFISQQTTFFIVTAVEASNLTRSVWSCSSHTTVMLASYKNLSTERSHNIAIHITNAVVSLSFSEREGSDLPQSDLVAHMRYR
jgi:hypothetical protein